MTKLKVFIDFEAISMPFNKEIKLRNEFPYAYTLGLYVGKKFKTKTYVFNFQQEAADTVDQVLKYNIIKNIRGILAKKDFIVSPDSVEFIGWSPILEKKILYRLFRGAEVKALNKGFELSLSRLTPEIKDDYFFYVRKVVSNGLSKEMIAKRSMESDGAIAAYIGYLLYSQVHNKEGKYYSKFEVSTLVKELKKYSKEDVTRMSFLYDNYNLFMERKDKALKLIKEKQVISKSIFKKERLLLDLQELNNQKTVEIIIKELSQEVEGLKKDKERTENDFKKI